MRMIYQTSTFRITFGMIVSDRYCESDDHEANQSIDHLGAQASALGKEEGRLRLQLEVEQNRLAIRELEEKLAALALNRTAEPTKPKGTVMLDSRTDLDPRVYLQKPTSSKYRPIVNYVSTASHVSDEEVSIGEGVTVRIAGQNRKKPRLENVTPAQWVAANSRILAELIEVDGCDMDTVLDYLSYTTKVGELANRFTWQSVMVYDDQYREKQARFGYRWGSDSPHIATVVPEERKKPNPMRSTGTEGKGRQQPKVTKDRRCVYFNEGRCFHGDQCKFQHACSTCGGSHPQSDHKGTESKEVKE
jgi:hypothetical protein